MPEYMIKGGLQPEDLIALMMDFSFSPHLICRDELQRLSLNQLRNIESADLIWIKSQ